MQKAEVGAWRLCCWLKYIEAQAGTFLQNPFLWFLTAELQNFLSIFIRYCSLRVFLNVSAIPFHTRSMVYICTTNNTDSHVGTREQSCRTESFRAIHLIMQSHLVVRFLLELWWSSWRGWRRSRLWLPRPRNSLTCCCPHQHLALAAVKLIRFVIMRLLRSHLVRNEILFGSRSIVALGNSMFA